VVSTPPCTNKRLELANREPKPILVPPISALSKSANIARLDLNPTVFTFAMLSPMMFIALPFALIPLTPLNRAPVKAMNLPPLLLDQDLLMGFCINNLHLS
jgi:hypothetical protein